VRVCVEIGSKRTFASALDWPGWCRAARGEQAALQALSAYAARYQVVAASAGLTLPSSFAVDDFEIVERVPGSATTDFGAPGAVGATDHEPPTEHDAARLASLVIACWAALDHAVANAPPQLRKGPRGGGRDRDAVAQHVLAAEVSYARKLGVRHKEPALGDERAISAMREAIIGAIRRAEPPAGTGWPVRFAARRIGWHAVDHAWEIEDRAEPVAI
jgi:hypothetical protein